MRSHRAGTRRVWTERLHRSAPCMVSEATPLAPVCRMCFINIDNTNLETVDWDVHSSGTEHRDA